MPRITISLSKRQLTWLRRQAKRLGITVGELVRRLLDDAREASDADAEVP